MAKIADIQQQVATQIADMMETEGLRWTKCWIAPQPPQNAISGHVYRGSNNLMTSIYMMMKGWKDPRFLTFNQARAAGGKVRKGEKSTPIFFYGGVTREDDDGNERRYRFGKVKHVFNVAQIDGLELPELQTNGAGLTDDQRNAAADLFVSNTGAVIETASAAFFQPQIDKIGMPDLSMFIDTDEATADEHYYSTLFHELVHWTGHKTRLARDLTGNQRSNSYAFEELIAEMGSVMAGVHLGIQPEPRADNAAYVQGWASRIRKDPDYLFKAASAAGSALTYLVDCQSDEHIMEEDAA